MTTAPLASAPAADRTAHQQDVLNDCVDLGHRLVRLVVDQAEAATIPAVPATIAFDRVTRSIRRCIWLERELAKPIKFIDRVAARKRIIRTVEDNIQRFTDGAEAATLHEELRDRLDTQDLEDEIGDRPVEDIIADIVRDLGLASVPGNHPWQRRTPDDIAQLVARAAQPVPAAARTQTPAAWPNQTHHRPAGCNSS